MVVLSDTARAAAHAEYSAELSAVREGTNSLTKTNIRDALNAVDVFLNANAAALNSAIPLPARTTLTTSQKARLLNVVVRYRYINGS